MTRFQEVLLRAALKRDTLQPTFQCKEKLTVEEVAEQMIEDLRGEQDVNSTSSN